MAIGKNSEDKQVLIDHSDATNNESRAAEVPSSSTLPILERSVSSSLKPCSDFDSEYEHFQSKVTFQTCSRPKESHSSSQPIGMFQCASRRLARLTRSLHSVRHWWYFHHKLLVSCILAVLGSAGCLIFFPLHLERVSRGGRGGIGDGYSACLAASTITTLLFLITCLVLEFVERRKWFTQSVLRPLVGWKSLGKIGFCLGLSFVTIFYSWEDDKVPCNFQDPLLGLVIIFAIITHAVCRWKSIGLKRAFALSAIAAGVFLSVDYPLVDHHRCRGYYYRNADGDTSITWAWQVHFVWTLAFVVSIWLATVAAFFLESAIPVPKVKHNRLYDLEYNAVKLRVLTGETSTQSQNQTDVTSWPGEESTPLKSYRFSPYTHFHFGLVASAVLWFSVATWVIILSLFWTEFIPGFGKGINPDKLPDRILTAFQTSLTNSSSWALFISIFTFTHSFTYLTILTRSPITSISVSTMGFPLIGLWWSFFQIKYSFFVWMPVLNGELICASFGLIAVWMGSYYFVQFEILKPAKVHRDKKRGGGDLHY